MAFLDTYAAFRDEFESYYAMPPRDVSPLMRAMDAESDAHPEWSPYRRKAMVYQTAAAQCDVQVFRTGPFFFEIASGRERQSWGFSGIGGWMNTQPFARDLTARGHAWWDPCSEVGLSFGYPVYDDDHHCVGYDNVLAEGLLGLIRRAEARMAEVTTEKERAFLESTILANRALISIAGRFADRAAQMCAEEADPAVRERLTRLAAAARHVPAHAPTTFYEALCSIIFLREACSSLEGIGISVFGHLDRMLAPYYARDLAAGRLTPEEAQDMLWAFLAITDAKVGVDKPYETSTCVVIGGCDAQGTVVYNAVTRMLIAGYQTLRLVNPKLNARISAAHPEEYFAALAALAASGANVLAILNDDVIIPANVRAGKALEDSRLYVSGGCQENVLQNTEVNNRATMYLNLLQVLHMGFAPKEWSWFTEREGIELIPLAQSPTFEAFYEGYLANLYAVMHTHITFRNSTERESWRMNPCPLLSATLSDCLENARDMLEGGTRYTAGSVSLIGVGTLIDALYAVKELVFTQGRLTLPELVAMLARDYAGDEIVRQYSVHRLPKFGQSDEGIRQFSARVFADLAKLSEGEVDARGGRYEASVFVYRFFMGFGAKTPATPDGRKAGEWLSQGMGPSYLGLGEQNSIAHLLEALEPLDLTQYPVTAVLDMKLPLMRGEQGKTVVSILRRFIGVGGSTLQLNVVDPATLVDARRHPERYPDLVVRVSGYSARFVVLPGEIQEELIARTMLA